MAVAYLIRHAEPVSPARHTGSDADRPLSERGRRQAASVAARLAGSGASAVLTSPYLRCLETAQVIAKSLKLEPKIALELHIASGFDVSPTEGAVICVAHSNNIPVALDRAGVSCHACGHASCWQVELDEELRVTRAQYIPNDS
jgi:8-oxo-dGTP diphosphatase